MAAHKIPFVVSLSNHERAHGGYDMPFDELRANGR